jgi:hypothetical protein
VWNRPRILSAVSSEYLPTSLRAVSHDGPVGFRSSEATMNQRSITPAFDYRMTRSMHAGLLNHLTSTISSPKECDGTRRCTETWLLENGGGDPTVRLTVVEAALDWLTEHAGNCDCTVILNTLPEHGFGFYGPADDFSAFNRWLDASENGGAR